MEEIKIKNVLLGSDCEFFLRDKESGEIVSAEGIIQGSKEEPFFFDETDKYAATSLDNVLAEGNIAPAKTPYEFYLGIEKLRKYIDSILPKNLELASIASARLDQKYLQTENAKLFGCSASFNAWTREIIHPKCIGDNLRASGFHIHCGYDEPSEMRNLSLIKAMDLFLGVPAVLIEPKNERKAVGYGKAGNFRHCHFGCEYRSLSGFFASTKELVEWCYNNSQNAIEFINDGGMDYIQDRGDEIQHIINDEDTLMAGNLIREFNIEMI